MEKYKRSLRGILKYKTSDEIRNKITSALEDETLTAKDYKLILEEVRKCRKILKPRNEIEWYPTIDKSICNNCETCKNFCPKGVYSVSENGVEVTNPYSCVLVCSHCSKLCPVGGISFPEKQDFIKYVNYE